MISQFVSWISDFMYGKLLIILLLCGGFYFTFRTRFVQFRMIRQAFKAIIEKPAEGEGKVSSFQALMVSTASRVGTGNIVGVSTASALEVLVLSSGCGSLPSSVLHLLSSKVLWHRYIRNAERMEATEDLLIILKQHFTVGRWHLCFLYS